MLKHRVIPSLLLKNSGLVKTIQFKNPKYIGDPINAIRIFNEKEVDELMVIDIGLGKNGGEPNYRLIEQFASECFMPLCYGGGIRTIDQATRLFNIGIEKILLHSLAFSDPNLVSKLADKFGVQSIVLSVNIKKNILKRDSLYFNNRKINVSKPWIQQIKNIVNSGVGEVLLTCVDREGTFKGPDLNLIREVSTSLSVPVIASGGIGSLQDIKNAIDSGASAVSVGSYFVFHGPHRAVLITYPEYSELETLLSTEN